MSTGIKLQGSKALDDDVPLDAFARINAMDNELLYLPIGILASGFFLAVFAIVYFRGWSTFASSHMWPTTPGVVTASRGATTNVPFSQSQEGITIPHVEYAYTVGGDTYIADTVAMDILGNDISRYLNAERTLTKYRMGSQIQVHYRPSDPRDTVLEYRVCRDPEVDLAFELMAVLAFCLACCLHRYMTVRPKLTDLERRVQAARNRGEF